MELARRTAGEGKGMIIFCSTKRECELAAKLLVDEAVCTGARAPPHSRRRVRTFCPEAILVQGLRNLPRISTVSALSVPH